jgi:prepilin-type N-terminal cleavage/methylation domain-containing protein
VPFTPLDALVHVRDDERGMTLVELLVALLVLGVVLSGIASMTISTLRVTTVNDARSVATNLAQAELERLRAVPFADLDVGGRTERAVEADGVVFDVVRDTSWAELDADTDPCAEPEGSVVTAMVRVDVEVARRDAADQAVRSSTTIARPPVAPSADVGAISVRVIGHTDPPEGVPSVRVRVTGPKPASGEVRIQHTPATGCVLFTDLPPGDYDVDLQRTGYVSMAADPEPVRTVGVVVGTRSAIELGYAPGGGLVLDAASRPGTDAGVLPASLPITVARDELVRVGQRGQQLTPLWPGRLELWAGDCPAADPLGLDETGAPHWPGASRQDRVAVPPAATGTAVAELAVVRTNVPGNVSNQASPEPVVLTVQSLDPCVDGTPTLTYGPLVPSTASGHQGNLDLAVPYGRWSITATNAAGQSATRYATVDPRSTGLVPTQAAAPPSPGAP